MFPSFLNTISVTTVCSLAIWFNIHSSVPFLNGMFKHISYYEYLSYDIGALQKQHNLFKLKQPLIDDKQFVKFQFHSLGRTFTIKLVRDNTIFHSDFILEGSGKKRLNADLSHLYHGKIFGSERSLVHGSIINGIFRGVIDDPQEGTYYVEENSLFFQGSNVSLTEHFQKGHSVIYHEKAVKFPEKFHSKSKCKLMTENTLSNTSEMLKLNVEKKQPNLNFPKRNKRQAYSSVKTTCLLYIQTDHFFFNLVGRSVDVVLSRVAEHVKRASTIFSETPFQTKSGRKFEGINFKVSKLQINDSSSALDPLNPFRFNYIGVEKFLDILSAENFDRYCLSYGFTSHDFEDGVLGLAWVANPYSAGGGICDEHRVYKQGEKGKSLNTGIITFVNYGTTVPSFVTHLTFSHELGHSMGSPHDETPECLSGGRMGHYIMHPRSTSGLLPHNSKFSPCSIRAISKVLDLRKNQCFVSPDFPICGNQLVDDGEECDCGFEEDCERNNDFCCNPADTTNECQLKPSASCSPSQGTCCTSGCRLKIFRDMCLNATECHPGRMCNGLTPVCDKVDYQKYEGKPCQRSTKTCSAGQCDGSICLAHPGLEQCYCSVFPNATKEIKKTLCHVCCQYAGKPHTCQSSASEQMKEFFPNGTIFLEPGSVCGNFNGYCDIFSSCRVVDAEGPISRITLAIFSGRFYRSIFAWIQNYWYAVVMLIFSLVSALTLFVKVFAVHTPTHYPFVTDQIEGLRKSVQKPIKSLKKRSKKSDKYKHSHHNDEDHEVVEDKPGTSKHDNLQMSKIVAAQSNKRRFSTDANSPTKTKTFSKEEIQKQFSRIFHYFSKKVNRNTEPDEPDEPEKKDEYEDDPKPLTDKRYSDAEFLAFDADHENEKKPEQQQDDSDSDDEFF